MSRFTVPGEPTLECTRGPRLRASSSRTALTSARLVVPLNAKLPDDIRVGKVETMPTSFHARFGARRKSYRYRINRTPVANPMERRFAWHVADALDLGAMCQAGATLIGQHDFAGVSDRGERRDGPDHGPHGLRSHS